MSCQEGGQPQCERERAGRGDGVARCVSDAHVQKAQPRCPAESEAKVAEVDAANEMFRERLIDLAAEPGAAWGGLGLVLHL